MNREPQRLVVAQLPTQPWKNGCGTTREIAAGDGWRLSVADVDRAAPFSAFPGIDRVIALLDGAGIRLRGDLSHDLVEPGEPFAFAGEAVVTGEPVDGPTRDLNVMTRRGAWHRAVHRIDGAAEVDAAEVLALVGLHGRYAEPAFGACEVLLWRDGAPRTRLVPEGDAAALAVRLWR